MMCRKFELIRIKIGFFYKFLNLLQNWFIKAIEKHMYSMKYEHYLSSKSTVVSVFSGPLDGTAFDSYKRLIDI